MSASEPTLEDHVLVARIRDGDEATFALLLDSWSSGMHRVAASYVATSAIADDVVQDAWLAVIEHIDSFEGRSTLKHWVFRIVANAAKTRARRDHRTSAAGSMTLGAEATVDPVRFRPSGETYPGHWQEPPAPWPSPEQMALATELRQQVTDAVENLPARQRAVIALRDIEGLTTSEEACELLDLSPANQRVLLHRARAAVRAELETYLETDV